MSSQHTNTRKAVPSDLGEIKAIADAERDSFGFLTRGTIREAIEQGQIMVIVVNGNIAGFQHYYHRKRDLQTTFYHKAVRKEWRGQGLGRRLVDAVVDEARALGRAKIVLKCPVDLPSNRFHGEYGFVLVGQELGRKRKLNVWQYVLQPIGMTQLSSDVPRVAEPTAVDDEKEFGNGHQR